MNEALTAHPRNRPNIVRKILYLLADHPDQRLVLYIDFQTLRADVFSTEHLSEQVLSERQSHWVGCYLFKATTADDISADIAHCFEEFCRALDDDHGH